MLKLNIYHVLHHTPTQVTGNYKVQLYDPRTNGFAPSSPEIGMHVEIRDPDDKIILSKVIICFLHLQAVELYGLVQVYSSEGKFTFTSHTPGEHVICLYSNSTKWFSGTQLRVHLDIQASFEVAKFDLGEGLCSKSPNAKRSRKFFLLRLESTP